MKGVKIFAIVLAAKYLKASPLISKAKKSPRLSDADSRSEQAEKLLPNV